MFGHCISQLFCCWDINLNILNLKEKRFYLVSGDSVHGWQAPRQEHHSEYGWWSKATKFMEAGKQSGEQHQEKGQEPDTVPRSCLHDLPGHTQKCVPPMPLVVSSPVILKQANTTTTLIKLLRKQAPSTCGNSSIFTMFFHSQKLSQTRKYVVKLKRKFSDYLANFYYIPSN